MRIYQCCAILFLLSGCAAGSSCQLSPPITLQTYYALHSEPIVLATLNGTPAALFLDTGSQMSILTPEMVKSASLPETAINPSEQFYGLAGGVAAKQTMVQEFGLGDSVGMQMQFPVIELFDRQTETADANAIDGILGADVFANYDLDLELADGKAVLSNANRCSKVMPPWTGNANAIPIQVESGRVYFPVKIEGRDFTALLDTGLQGRAYPSKIFN